MGPFGQIVVPIKNYKLVQISIGLPERASKNMQLLKESAFHVNVNSFLI